MFSALSENPVNEICDDIVLLVNWNEFLRFSAVKILNFLFVCSIVVQKV